MAENDVKVTFIDLGPADGHPPPLMLPGASMRVRKHRGSTGHSDHTLFSLIQSTFALTSNDCTCSFKLLTLYITSEEAIC